MLIHSSSQLLTLAGGPQRGHALGTLGIIENGAVVVRDERIVAVGTTAELRASYPNEPTLDASGCVLMPGFVDPHTHVIWGGDRANEFEMKMAGAKYLDILAAGGGIISTVRATRTASIETLIAQTRPRLLRMFAHGTTTVEAKTGYGLQTATELRLLKALLALDDETPLDLSFTFLGAHAIAPEYRDDPQGYTDLVCKTMLPMLKEWWGAHAPRLPLPFVDVFCENQAFDLKQSRQILTKARELGFPLKIHADEFDNLGGAALAARAGGGLGRSPRQDVGCGHRRPGKIGHRRRGVAVHTVRTRRKGVHSGPQIDRSGCDACPGDRLQPGHVLERVHAVGDRPGLPLHGADSRAGHRCCDDQCRPRHPQVRYDRLHRTGQTGGYADPVRARLPSSRLPLWDEPGKAGHQKGTGLFGGCGILSDG